MNAPDVDYEALAEGVEGMREVIRAFVASLVADGFTDREARVIIAGLWAAKMKEATEGTEDEQ